MYRIISTLLITLFSSWSFAEAPRISSASLNDEGLVISGSGFGAENPMLFWDDVKSSFEETGALLGQVVDASENSKWKVNGNQWGTPLTHSDLISNQIGRKEVVYYGEGHKNFLGKPNHPVPDSLKNEMYVSWWYRPSQHPNAEGAHNKFIRIWDETNGKGTRISWTQVQLGAGACETKWGTWDGKVGEWNHHAIHVDLANKEVKTWINGKLKHTSRCEKDPGFKDNPLYVQLLGFDHGMRDYQSMTTAFKDIYIGTTPARVEISNSATWSETMVKEILPIKRWSHSEIVAMPHDGAIKLSNEAYIYVVGADGVANPRGVKLKCESCPNSPL